MDFSDGAPDGTVAPARLAHAHASQALRACEAGELATAEAHHANAARLFLAAAEDVPWQLESGVKEALLLLAAAHARSAKQLQLVLQRGRERSSGPARPSSPASITSVDPSHELHTRATGPSPDASPVVPAPKAGPAPDPAPTAAPFQPECSVLGVPSSSMVQEQARKRSESADQHAKRQVDELVQLERRLLKFGMGLRPRNANDAVRESRLLSSTLGESFLLLGPRATTTTGAPPPELGGSQAAHLRLPHPRSAAGYLSQPADDLRPSQSSANLSSPLALANSGAQAVAGGNATGGSAGLAKSVVSFNALAKGGVLDANQSAEVHAEQVIRLLQSMKQLSDENAKLLQEQMEWQRIREESTATKDTMERFRDEFRKRCEEVRESLVQFRQRYPNPANPANDVLSTREARRVQELEIMVRKLCAKLENHKKSLAQATQESRRKDEKLRRYEEWCNTVQSRAKVRKQQQQQQQQQQQPSTPYRQPPAKSPAQSPARSPHRHGHGQSAEKPVQHVRRPAMPRQQLIQSPPRRSSDSNKFHPTRQPGSPPQLLRPRQAAQPNTLPASHPPTTPAAGADGFGSTNAMVPPTRSRPTGQGN